ncbi:ABC transporter substrate-binding protein [uncultured Ferrovibrio sp.]|jgi:peptide/nickel transport system substrate-binding protein|uniref:ABC transporter substrate-binding protein n=1 Tax=uncultured Ferrovibrio sp. TaxID=1576913 RepID=UPI002606721E|nr:ABC transporter substrate-binding protein [uncultured Ferrovibrio sp.]
MTRIARIMLLLALLLPSAPAVQAQQIELQETPSLAAEVAAGRLPPIDRRVPEKPLVVSLKSGQEPGRQGGELRTLIGRARDVRLLSVINYTRLVVYNEDFEFVPDLAASFEVEDERIFTFHLRPGHKWSDGHPFTSEDFRYFWEDIALNKELSPAGPPADLRVNGELPEVSFPDQYTVRYAWSQRNPYFLPRIAGTAPLYLYRPAHYMKRFHIKYADREALDREVAAAKRRNWAALHNKLDNMFELDNPDLPTLDPWIIKTRPPAIRFVAQRNPYFHRVDQNGFQLPYIERVILTQADAKLIPAKAGAGEADLQFRNISFNNFTFLKENEKRAGNKTLLWRTAKGAHFALFPNLNCNDPTWRDLMRNTRFRQALSLAIDRQGINESLFFGLAIESNNTVLPGSPLFKPEYQTTNAIYDPAAANRLLDEIGLTKRDSNGIRLLPDGRPLEIIVETAGEDTEQTDILELIGENWVKIGVKLFAKPSQRDVVRNRIFSGEAIMSVWTGLENGLAKASTIPSELAPTSQYGLQWPKWGQWRETNGQSGEPVDMPVGQELLDLLDGWLEARSEEERARIWHRMLAIHAEQTLTIGVVSGTFQPIVVNKKLVNIPKEGVFNWDPGAFIGIYRPETFWLRQ